MKQQCTMRLTALAATAVLAAVGVAGCSKAPAPTVQATMSKGTQTTAAAPAPSGSGGTPTASSSPATPGSSPGSSPAPSQPSMLDAVKHPNCSTATFLQETGVAGGALRTYVGKPAAAAPSRRERQADRPGPLRRGLRGRELQHAKNALKGCPRRRATYGPSSTQNVTLLTTFKQELAAGKVVANRS